MASKAYAVEITQAASEDFLVALSYYMRVAGKASAERFAARYAEVIDYLEDVPEAATKIGDTGCLWLPIRNHVLVYRIDDSASKVYVLRIHYGSSNWRQLLEKSATA